MNIVLIAALVGGYYLFNSTKDDLLNKIKYRFGGVAFDGVGGDFKSVRIIVKLIIDNGTDFPLPVDGFVGNLYYNGQLFTPIAQTESTAVKANLTTTLKYGVSVGKDEVVALFGSWEKALTFLKSVVTGGFRLKGKITLRLANLVYYQDIDQEF